MDAAVIHYLLYRPLARAVSHQLGQRAGAELRPEHRAEARERRGAEPVPDTCQTEEEGNNCARDRPWQHGTAGPGKERGDAGQRASPRVLEPPPRSWCGRRHAANRRFVKVEFWVAANTHAQTRSRMCVRIQRATCVYVTGQLSTLDHRATAAVKAGFGAVREADSTEL